MSDRSNGAASTNRSARKRKAKKKKLSRTQKPEHMSLEDWQTALRRQFGREQKFVLKNMGEEPVFSDFQVTNRQSNSAYRVAIRGANTGENFCTCPDFSTNTLGTCKHIEFTLAKVRRKSGAKAALRAGFTPPYSEIVLQYGSRRQVRFRPGAECPPGLREIAGTYFDDSGILQNDAFPKFEKFLEEGSKFEHDLRCYDDALAFVAEVRDADVRRRRIDDAFPDGIRSSAFEKLLKVPLYDYQREGALFAARAGRCLIGDEMGLGKTAQAIAAAEMMAAHVGVERVLVVCPTSLKHQWEREVARFCARPAQVISGMRVRREQCFASNSFYKITNYDTIHRDLDLIGAWSPDLVILDEAQRIKSWNTRAARSVKQIVSPYAIVLTGTPLENRLEELVSIVQFVDQHRLGPTFRFLADHQVHDEVGRVVGYRNLDTIGKTLAPVLIRRHKDQVLKQLPERLDKHLFVPMTPQQRGHHEENREVVGRIVAKWRRLKFLSETDQRRLMMALQNMRMSCDSTYLLDHETDFGTKADELTTLLSDAFETQNEKAVIFSQWVRMHEVLLKRIRRTQWGHVLFHGGVPGPKRKALVDRFREDDKCRAFLSTDAGGVGLNLQNASLVVNVDLPWNPAVLEQRIGRVHRLGQTRPVRVVNLIAQGTIEQGMLSLIEFKRSLFAGALDGGAKEIFMEGGRLKRFMDSVDQATGSIPPPTIEEAPGPEPTLAQEMRAPEPAPTTPIIAVPADGDPWAGLLTSGLTILEQLAAAARPTLQPAAAISQPGISIVHRDEKSGEQYLRLPMPNSETLDRILGAVGTLLERFRR